MQAENARKKAELQAKMKEQELLQYELGSLKKKAKVYRQQQNSNVLFLSSMEQEMQRAKKNLKSLKKEYQEHDVSGKENLQTEEREEEDDTDDDKPRHIPSHPPVCS